MNGAGPKTFSSALKSVATVLSYNISQSTFMPASIHAADLYPNVHCASRSAAGCSYWTVWRAEVHVFLQSDASSIQEPLPVGALASSCTTAQLALLKRAGWRAVGM
jgi:hypothetical protein